MNWPWRRKHADDELSEELQFHLERQAAENIANGMETREARRQARIALDGVERTKKECRDVRIGHNVENLVKDLRYAGRMLRRSPLFAVSAAATLALGIGATTAIFSVTDAVLLRPLPYPHPERLALVFWEERNYGKSFLYSSADFIDLRNGTRTIFDDMGGVAGFRAYVPSADGGTEQVSKALVTTNFFRLMGARIAFGRDFTEADAAPQPPERGALIPSGASAILSYDFWQRRFAGSRSVIGQELPGIEGQRGPRIVGVLAPGFKLLFPPDANTTGDPDFWVANNIGYDTAHRNLLAVGAVGRLKSGLTLHQAQQRLEAVAPGLKRGWYVPTGRLRLETMGRYLVDQVRPSILALMGAAAFLLLIACANVACLVLGRTAARERELAVRAALGGSRGRLARQLLAEATLLSALGTALGIVLAWSGTRALVALAPADLPRIGTVAVDWHVFAFAALCGLAAAALFGLAPAMRAARPDLVRVLRAAARTTASGGALRSIVVIAEVALSFVLLVGSGLMFRSFLELRRVDPGYDPHGILTFWLTRDWPLPRQNGRIELLREMQDRLREVPGVQNVTAALILPLGGGRRERDQAPAPGAPQHGSSAGAEFQQVMPGYFATLRTRLLAGRTFTAEDNAPDRGLAVIDDLEAARAFPGEQAVGQRISLPGTSANAEVIGVVRHQRLATLASQGLPTVYLTDGFWGIGVSRYWMMRVSGDPAKYAPAVRRAMSQLDRRLVVSNVRTLDTLAERDRAGTRFALLLTGAFALIAVLLAMVGLYGVVAGAARQRTMEIGVRMAIGADAASIFRLIAGQGLRLTAVGIGAGLAGAAAVTRVLASMLVGVQPIDGSTFAAAAALFLAVGTAASGIPATRAALLDPVEALRQE